MPPPATTPRAQSPRSARRRASACSPPAGGSPSRARAPSAPARLHAPALLCRRPAELDRVMVRPPAMRYANMHAYAPVACTEVSHVSTNPSAELLYSNAPLRHA